MPCCAWYSIFLLQKQTTKIIHRKYEHLNSEKDKTNNDLSPHTYLPYQGVRLIRQIGFSAQEDVGKFEFQQGNS